MKTIFYFLFTAGILLVTIACNHDSLDQIVQKPIYFRSNASPEWARAANIYKADIQTYTTQGTFSAFAALLPNLKKNGVKIIALPPIQSPTDYQKVDPKLGTAQDFINLVRQTHDLDMKVIIEWLPSYYIQNNKKNYTGTATVKNMLLWELENTAPDATLRWDFNDPALREIVLEDMLFWLKKAEVDGFSCGKTTEVPDKFWLDLIPRLRTAKPDIFMLAESEYPPYLNLELFTAVYNHSFYDLLNEIVNGNKNALVIDKWHETHRTSYIAGYYIYDVTQSATLNKKNKSEGQLNEALAVLASTFEGIPLIDDKAQVHSPFYTTLLELKQRHRALWNGVDGGSAQRIQADNSNVYAFLREKYDDKVLVIVNLSDQPQRTMLEHEGMTGIYNNVFDGSVSSLPTMMTVELEPWGYKVFAKRQAFQEKTF